jgi:hypothetical protein
MKTFAAAAVVMGSFYAGSVAAQPSITVGTASGQPGDTVTIPVSFDNDGSVVGMNFDIQFDNTNLPTVDLSNCNGNDMSPGGVTCTNPSPGTISVAVATFPLAPIASTQVGTIDFTIDGGSAFTTYDLTLANVSFSDSGGNAVTPDQLNNGSIDVVSGPQSELSLTPASIDFGTVDLGVMPVTDTFTLENIGDAGTTITVNSITYSGDAAFTSSDNCTTLNAGDTCTATITFDTGTNGTYSGSIAVDSDATVNPTPSGAIDGVADSAPSLSINPPFGPVNLGTVVVGSSATANGSVSNAGSADGSITCNYTGDPEISVTPDLSGGVTVPAGDSVGFSISCAVPDTAVEGDTFSGTLSCSGDLTGTHDLSCGATEFVPLPVPTNSKWGLAILSLLVLMIGGLTVRFFRT